MSKMSDIHAFCQEVGDIVEAEYGREDGDDLCYNLIEVGDIVLTENLQPADAARIVAQYMEQQ